jgi:hypothetical protein
MRPGESGLEDVGFGVVLRRMVSSISERMRGRVLTTVKVAGLAA